MHILDNLAMNLRTLGFNQSQSDWENTSVNEDGKGFENNVVSYCSLTRDIDKWYLSVKNVDVSKDYTYFRRHEEDNDNSGNKRKF